MAYPDDVAMNLCCCQVNTVSSQARDDGIIDVT